MPTTNKGYNLGLAFEQGIGFSENTGYWPMPEARVGVFVVHDNNDQPHVIVLDHKDGKFYDVTTRDGPIGTGMVRQVKDKVGVSGTGGYDIATSVSFKEDRGEYEKFVLDHMLTKMYVRPDKETNRGVSGYDSEGFLSDIEFQSTVFTDGEPDTAVATAEDVGVNGDIVYDRKARGNRLQTKLSTTKGGFKLTGRQSFYKVEDIPVTFDSKITTEGDHQENLSNPLMKYSRNNLYLNRVTGTKVSGTPVSDVGPDGVSNSAFILSSAKSFGTISSVAAKTVVVWVSGTSNAVSAKIGGTNVPLINYSGSNSWYLNYASGVTASGDVVLSPTTTGSVCDFSIHTGDKSDDLAYYFNDVVFNNGNNVMPL